MDVILLIARVVLAAVFVFAGVTKLLDLAGSRRGMREFGLPATLSGPAGVVVPDRRGAVLHTKPRLGQ